MNLHKTGVLFTQLTLMLVASSAQATIVWNWSNAGTGTEAGTFTTDGDLVSGLATAGTYNVTDFSLDMTNTSIALGSVSGGQYVINQPGIGFIWDGNAPTQFFRNNGVYSNGFQFNLDPAPSLNFLSRVNFGANYFAIDGDDEIGHAPDFFQESQTINLTPVAVPEPTSLALVGLSGVTMLSRRRFLRSPQV